MFTLADKKYDEFDDMPVAPGAAGDAVAVENEGDADMFEGVGKLGETIPNGTFHFRLDAVIAKGATVPTDQNKQPLHYDDGSEVDPQPWFMVGFKCQQEPHTGKSFAEFVGWVSAKAREKAKAGDSQGKELLRRRLVRAKAIMEAAGFKPTGAYNLERDFFSTNPEVRIQVGQGKNKQTGEDQNKAVKYFPLNRPA